MGYHPGQGKLNRNIDWNIARHKIIIIIIIIISVSQVDVLAFCREDFFLEYDNYNN